MTATDTQPQTFSEADRRVLEQLSNDLEVLQESHASALTQLSIAIDDKNWRPLGSIDYAHEMKLQSVKDAADVCQALIAVNPLVRRGIAVRTSYIWGDGVELVPKDASWSNASIMRTFGTSAAQYEMERSLAASGQLFFLVNRTTKKVQRVPLHQISDAYTDADDLEEVKYFRRSWTEEVGGRVVEKTFFYPNAEWALDLMPGQKIDAAINVGGDQRIKVDQTRFMVRIAVNKQIGWTWGLPDVFPAIFWSKAYNEFLEGCSALVKAYAQFAWKVTATTTRGARNASAAIARGAHRDPLTGEERNGVGGTAVMAAGNDLTALGRNSNVDFKAGSPLAAMVAATLEVPLSILTADGNNANRAGADALEEPTVKAFRARQSAIGDGIGLIKRCLGVEPTPIEWPPVGEEPTHRLIQAISVAWRDGLLFPAEARALVLRALSYASSEEEPPAKEAPIQGSTTNQIEPGSYGDKELRDEGTQQHTEDT